MRLEDILQRQPVWRGAGLAQCPPGVPTGFDLLDAGLPGGGWPRGELTELLGETPGIGELQLVLPALARLSNAGKRVVWLGAPHLPYPPALAAAGLDLAQLVVVQPRTRQEALWAAEQVLRAAAAPALLAWTPRVRYAELRRLAVAAEAGGGVAFLFRPPAAAREPSPASLRLVLEPGAGELALRILKRRGAPAGGVLRLPLALPCHALGRSAPAPAGGDRAARRLGLPVHA
ncbi:MAG TPA: translesion DNA synthesis-associated protein ImuA [Burkholderiales bacterium]